MKRLFSLLCITVLTLSSVHADTYHDALLDYFSTNNSAVSPSQYEQMLYPIVTRLFPDKTEKAGAILGEYVSGQLMADMADIYDPVYRKYMSEQDLKELTKIFSDQRLVQIQQRVITITSNFSQSEEYHQFVEQLSNAINAIIEGQQPLDITIPASIAPEYYELFQRYYSSSGTNKIMEQTFSSVTGMLENSLRSGGVQNVEYTLQEIVSYMHRNIPISLATIFRKTLNADDMRLLISATDTDVYKRSINATTEVVGNPMKLAAELTGKMADWMSINYPDYAAPLQEMYVMLKAMQ